MLHCVYPFFLLVASGDGRACASIECGILTMINLAVPDPDTILYINSNILSTNFEISSTECFFSSSTTPTMTMTLTSCRLSRSHADRRLRITRFILPSIHLASIPLILPPFPTSFLSPPPFPSQPHRLTVNYS